MMTQLLDNGPIDAPARLILAHGAGAPMTSSFMETFARLLAECGIAVTRFEFGYMAMRRTGGKRRPPPKAELLKPEYLATVAMVAGAMPRGQKLLLGGKSLGGRVASLIADDLYRASRVSGLVCVSYPFHPPNKPAELRTAHLAALACPTLIVQGERDPFGSRAEVDDFTLSTAIRFHWAADGDHDLAPRRRLGHTRRDNLEAAAAAVADFARSLTRD
jgi:predicted alpha/beta-hydrolase family hydrolase